MSEMSIDELLATYDPTVRAIALKAREVVLATLPDVIEMVDVPAKMLGYGYEQTYKGSICGIALHKSHVNLMFSKGTELSDPDGLLEGTGKKARHVKLTAPEGVERAPVIDLLTAAAALTRAGLGR
jgi:hypothetical protein